MSLDITTFRRLYPFRSHYLDRNGLKYHYLDEGRGDPVVMLHGNPTWSFYYRNLIKTLAPRHRVIAPDHMGCGLSDKPGPDRYDYRLKSRVSDLEALLDRLEVNERITLVLHDWGGMIGLVYAIAHPGRVRRLVVMNTSGFLPPHGKRIPLRLRIIRDLAPFATPAVLGLNLFARSALYMATRKGLPPDVKTGLIAPYNSWKNRIATLKFVQDIPLRPGDPGYALVKNVDDNLHTLSSLPILICWGERDFVFDAAYLDEFRRRLPGAEVHAFPDAGHYVLEDKSEQIQALVKTFLQENHP